MLLAAGAGRRLGRPKAAVTFAGELLVERGLRLLADGGCDPVAVVLGAAAEDVVAAADLRGAAVVVAEDWPEGMGASLRAGLSALEGTCEAAVVALVDQPLIGPEVIRRLTRVWRRGEVAAVAAYGGVARNPALFDRSVWAQVRASAVGDRGARAWLRANAERVAVVECGDVGRPDDLDTAGDLERLSAELGRWAPPA